MISFLLHVLLSIVLLGVGTFLFEVTTKNKEFNLIFAKGNKTAAFVLGGKVFGLAIVLESALRNSISLLDLLVWGAIGIVTQIVVYILADLATPKYKFYDLVEKDRVSAGLLLFLMSLSIGFIISGALTY